MITQIQNFQNFQDWAETVDEAGLYAEIDYLQTLLAACPNKKCSQYHWLRGFIDAKVVQEFGPPITVIWDVDNGSITVDCSQNKGVGGAKI